MARSSQTDMAVLGALSIEPMTGYAVREMISTVLGHFWSESFGQIYPALKALEQDGLVERGKRFAITAAGESRLRELLRQPIHDIPPRNGLMIRIFFGRTLGAQACRELIEQTRADAESRLAEYERLLAENATESGPDTVFIRMTLLAGKGTAEAAIAWADECLVLL